VNGDSGPSQTVNGENAISEKTSGEASVIYVTDKTVKPVKKKKDSPLRMYAKGSISEILKLFTKKTVKHEAERVIAYYTKQIKTRESKIRRGEGKKFTHEKRIIEYKKCMREKLLELLKKQNK
jgi:hypothetical protein